MCYLLLHIVKQLHVKYTCLDCFFQELSSMFFLSASTAKIVQILTENKIFKMSFNVLFSYKLECNVVVNIRWSLKTNYD